MNTNTNKVETRRILGNVEIMRAVVAALGGELSTTEEAYTLDAETAKTLNDVNRHGAAAGFSGFIYYADTFAFFAANRDAIRAHLETTAAELWDCGAIELVMEFHCLKGGGLTTNDVGRALWGPLPEFADADDDAISIANACTWFALEECARAWGDAEELDA